MAKRLVAVLGLTMALAAVLPLQIGHAAGDAYRRWTGPKDFSCSTLVGGGVQILLADQDVEFANLPPDATFTINYVVNGVTTTDGPYPVEQTSGTKSYGAFAQSFPSYPANFEFRLDTLIGGVVVYQSSLVIDCTADTTGTVSPVNYAPELESYRRWVSPKDYTCSTLVGGGVQILLADQDVEFANLPPDATFTINYVVNGVTTTDGPYPVEQTSGTKSYGAFAQSFPSYPANFEFRLDTLIGGVVVYQSSLVIDCTADTTGTVDAVSGPPTTTTSTTTTTTTTTVAAAPTTLASTTTVPAATTTTVAAAPTTTVPAVLPATGSRSTGPTIAAVLAVLLGASLVAIARRPEPADRR